MDNLYSSFYLYKKYEIIGDELIDLGITSVDADGTQEPVMKEECDPACGCPEPIYRWVQTEDTVCVGEEPAVQYRWTPSGWTCVGYDKYQNNIKEQSLDEGLTWTVVIPEEYSASTLIEADSPDCGYVPPTPASPKFILTLNDSSTVSAECDSSSAITESEVSDYSSSAVSVVIGDCVTTIDQWTFGWWNSLTSVTISDSVTSISAYAFLKCTNLTSVTIGSGVTNMPATFMDCSALTSVTILATTPPELGGINTFYGASPNLVIYVPCESVSAYQSATYWSDLASRIQGIPPCEPPTPTIEYRWTQSGTTCIGYDKYQNNIKEQSTDGGTTWTVVIPEEYSASTLIESQSTDCGYVPPTPSIDGKYKFTLNDSSVVSAECSSNPANNGFGPKDTSAYTGSVVSIAIGDCVPTIGMGAFTACTALTDVTIGSGITEFGSSFKGCSNLTGVSFSNNLTAIIRETFSGCTSLTSVNIPSGVTKIYSNTFAGCISLANIVLPNNVTEIQYGAFTGCTSLTNVNIPSGVISIGQYAFGKCQSLTNITIPNSVTTLGSSVFSRCTGLTSAIIPDNVTSIGWAVFANCTSLSSVTIGSGITGITTNLFSGCTSLSSITIPNTITSIDSSAFYGCSGLTSITIPDSVTALGGSAFSGCSSLTSVTCLATTPPTLPNSNAFKNTNDCPIYVPSASVSAYQSANNWSYLASRIQAIP